MRAIRLMVEQMLRRAGRLTATSPDNPTFFVGQKHGAMHVSDIAGLPVEATEPIIVTDPNDPNFGKFYFMVDFDPVDGDAPIL